MAYEDEYKNRSTAKRHSTKTYTKEEIENIKSLIQDFYKEKHPEVTLNTNEAYFDPLVEAINEARFDGKVVIKAKYLSEIYNGIDTSKKKSIEKMTAIKEFLRDWLGFNKGETSNQFNKGSNSWHALTNTSTPQWTDFIALPSKNSILKRLTCEVFTKTKYYRFGFKFLRTNDKLFGDGSIQSQDNNFIIHIGKNFIENELFITTYKNGIREHSDIYTNIIPKKNGYACEFCIDAEYVFHFFINGKEVYKKLMNKEICYKAYMLVWGDGNKYDVQVKNIKIETERV